MAVVTYFVCIILQVFRTFGNVGSNIECGSFCAPKKGCNTFALETATSQCHIMDMELPLGTDVAPFPIKAYTNPGYITMEYLPAIITFIPRLRSPWSQFQALPLGC